MDFAIGYLTSLATELRWAIHCRQNAGFVKKLARIN